MSPRRPTLQAVHDLGRSAAVIAALCESILLGGRWDGKFALTLLPDALQRLSTTIAQMEAALAQEDLT